eukprot:9838491-Alexandrium_andersonii.AAC.1
MQADMGARGPEEGHRGRCPRARREPQLQYGRAGGRRAPGARKSASNPSAEVAGPRRTVRKRWPGEARGAPRGARPPSYHPKHRRQSP